MTDSTQPDSGIVSNSPEPPFEELYRLYLDSLAHDRRKMIAEAADLIGDCHLEEFIAQELQPVSPEEFQRHLDDLSARGVRRRFVTSLVLGPEYCDANPDDEHIKMPAEEQAEWNAEFQKGLIRSLRSSSPPPRRTGHRRG